MQKIDSSYRSRQFPYWLKKSIKIDSGVGETKELLYRLQIGTVCQSAKCPNIYDCFSNRRCSFLILGGSCTRGCRFCSIEKLPIPSPVNKQELFSIKEAVRILGLTDVVITSGTRDDLYDGGAGHFADCIEILRDIKHNLNIEVLVPDFLGKRTSIETVVSAEPSVFSHNLETVPRLYSRIMPEADYKRSLDVIRCARDLDSTLVIKSGLMVGLGETIGEIYTVMQDLKDAGCDRITVGQYLKPDSRCVDVEEFLHPDRFILFSKRAEEMGFKEFSCSPFTRSSYMAKDNGLAC